MKVYSSFLVAALCVLPVANAFVVGAPKSMTSTSLHSTPEFSGTIIEPMFPPDLDRDLKKIQGGNTVVTYQMPVDCERVQMMFMTEGRPMKAYVEMWLGPLRRTHGLDIDSEDGSTAPILATLKFKKGPQVLKVATKSELQFPMLAAVRVPSKERSKELDAITMSIWKANTPTLVQGGDVQGGGGAVRTFNIPDNVDAVQVLVSSKSVGGKSCRAKIEILQGPNNLRQKYALQCSGGSQPYHAVFHTPGEGNTVRIVNNKFVEDGLFECMVLPYNGE